MSSIIKKVKVRIKATPVLGPLLSILRKAAKRAIKYTHIRNADILDVYIEDTQPYLDAKNFEGQSSTNSDLFYLEFESLFRGTKEIIKSRQTNYLEYVHRAHKLSENSDYFLDIGCGRGEFLEVLNTAKIPAMGLEINKIEYEDLLKRGFNVYLGDSNTFLKNVKNNSLIGISAFQVIEHFTPSYLQDFIKLSYEKIAENGVLILETVNPKCHIALSNFFLDITHVRPYPPETVKFLLEWYGFKDICIIYSSPCSKGFRIKNIKECNYMDCGIIAWRK